MTGWNAEAWEPLAEVLADELTDRGVLTEAVWRAALTSVPRHRVVPSFYLQDSDATWREVTEVSSDYLPTVYSNAPLVTALTHNGPSSSSSQPSLMIRMLETLRIEDDDKVLEIGTGTGYNTGLLSHRLHDRNVYSVEVDTDLVDRARDRLNELGWRPSLAAVDGAHGWAANSPFDKIIATCSVQSVPWAWVEQTAVGGHILVDVKIGRGAGNLVLLDRGADRAEGRFLSGWAGFMGIRRLDDEPAPLRTLCTPAEAATGRLTPVDLRPWQNQVVWFLAMVHLPADIGYGFILDTDTRAPAASRITAPDGSWCTVELEATDGSRRVMEAGPTPLWEHVERAFAQWAAWGEPTWERFGLTVTPSGHTIWLDHPTTVVNDWR